MKRTKLADRDLPNYTKGEEIFNMVSHIVGGALGIAMAVLTIVFASLSGDVLSIIGTSIYGGSIITLYCMSSIYHGLRHSTGKKVMQILDHCTIYLLIAGTYTAVIFSSLISVNLVVFIVMLSVVWFLAIVLIVLTAIDLKMFNAVAMPGYLGLGWCAIFAVKDIFTTLTPWGTLLLFAGGVLYSIGAVLFIIGKKKKYAHALFHIFVILGSLSQFFCILFFCLL